MLCLPAYARFAPGTGPQPWPVIPDSCRVPSARPSAVKRACPVSYTHLLLPGHIPAIAAAERQCFSDPWSENLLRQELQNPLSRWFVLLLGGQVAGYAATLHICGEVHITRCV